MVGGEIFVMGGSVGGGSDLKSKSSVLALAVMIVILVLGVLIKVAVNVTLLVSMDYRIFGGAVEKSVNKVTNV
ncbi:MAG: hypothetical protein U0518_00735 [Candidatus Gracilibacteria bacterium]